MNAVAYHDYKAIAMQAVLASHARLSAAYPVVMVEGAGSPAEINLRAGDIANMGFAEAVDCPVLLIADIRSEEHTSELQSLMRTSYAVFCLKKKNHQVRHPST